MTKKNDKKKKKKKRRRWEGGGGDIGKFDVLTERKAENYGLGTNNIKIIAIIKGSKNYYFVLFFIFKQFYYISTLRASPSVRPCIGSGR